MRRRDIREAREFKEQQREWFMSDAPEHEFPDYDFDEKEPSYLPEREQ